jgi:hypothetical protein
LLLFVAWSAIGCNDRCEGLCDDVADAIDSCRSESLSWADLGARNKQDFTTRCNLDWDRTTAEIGARDLELALDVCADAQDEMARLSCDEVMALYGQGD